METESTPPQTPTSLPPSNIPSSVIGYVDPRTDPDRPSLATAAIIGRPPPLQSHSNVSLSGSEKHGHLPIFPTAQTPLKSLGLSTSGVLPHHNPKPAVQSSPLVNPTPPEPNLHPELTHTSAAATETGIQGLVSQHGVMSQPSISVMAPTGDNKPSDHPHRPHPVSPTGKSAKLSHSTTDAFMTHPPPSAPHTDATNHQRKTDSSSLFAFSPIRQTNRTQSFQSSLLRSVLSD